MIAVEPVHLVDLSELGDSDALMRKILTEFDQTMDVPGQ